MTPFRPTPLFLASLSNLGRADGLYMCEQVLPKANITWQTPSHDQKHDQQKQTEIQSQIQKAK